ncbi:hypothetical protein BURMUCF2_A2223 [Burkholderia multivorans CF2]|nr:hypothetical protein BURMUCF2_A2223 [Burkholderia multivorans CF2]
MRDTARRRHHGSRGTERELQSIHVTFSGSRFADANPTDGTLRRARFAFHYGCVPECCVSLRM